jgi:hypothetical protein
MDTALLMSVIGRHKLVITAGFVIALVLAFFSVAKVDPHRSPYVSYRKAQQWASYSRILVAQPGFTVGSTLAGAGAAAAQALDTKSAADSRMPALATIYASFVTGDSVQKLIERHGPMRGELQAVALPVDPTGGGGGVLPVISIAALADSTQYALSLGNRATVALQEYIAQQQQANGVPPSERVQLIVLNKAGQLKLIKPRSKALPIAVFLVVMFAFVGFAFLLENRRRGENEQEKTTGSSQPLRVPDASRRADLAS